MDHLRRNLDCAVIRRLYTTLKAQKLPGIDTLKGVFIEGHSVYPGAGFRQKTHIQIAVRNPRRIKGVFSRAFGTALKFGFVMMFFRVTSAFRAEYPDG